MFKVLEEALYLAVLDLTALQDLMNFIAHKTCEEQIDKDVLQIFHKLNSVLGQAYAFFAAGKDFESQFVFNILDDSAQTLLG